MSDDSPPRWWGWSFAIVTLFLYVSALTMPQRYADPYVKGYLVFVALWLAWIFNWLRRRRVKEPTTRMPSKILTEILEADDQETVEFLIAELTNLFEDET